ncbi:MAG: class I SAM-dependent methyltransferase [Bacilli bacterium]|nr:class I SAM-dependent methyltransferase [Bacilli bacterium]
MNEENLIKYYNKFNEEKRLNTRHGQVEFITSMKYIKEYLSKMNNPKIIDIGAGCGKYSIELANNGYDVTAVELIKHNLRVIEKNSNKVKTYLGNAINLSRFNDETFDLVLLFGPMYHLISKEDKIKALNEAKRIVKKDGIIMVAYCMNDYAVITHGFKDNNILDSIDKLDENFKIISTCEDLYSVVRIEDIDELNKITDLKRIKIVTSDGPSNYIRSVLNKMSDLEFSKFIEYHLSTCERKELLGAAAHTLDILKK